jgi:hypothetical protein
MLVFLKFGDYKKLQELAAESIKILLKVESGRRFWVSKS